MKANKPVNVKKIALFITLVFFTSFAVFKISNITKEEHEKKPVVVVPKEPGVIHFAAGAPQLAYLKIAAVEMSQVPTVEALQGYITYNEDVTARITSPVAGRVTQIYAKVGDKVKLNQQLATIDSPDFGQANADLIKAQSDLKLKQQAYERGKTLYEGEVIAKKDFEVGESDLKQSEAEYQRALGRLKNYGISKNNNFVLSTKVAGIVTERQINPGSEVKPDNASPLFIVSDPKKLWINIEVPEKDLSKISLNQHLSIAVGAYPNEIFKAKIILISKVLDPDTRRIIVRCEIDNIDDKLKPQMYIYATPLDGEASLPHVPNEAIITEGVKNFVFVERAPGVIEKRLIKISYQGHVDSFVTEGIREGERIVTLGALLLNSELAGN
jgi:cobalt-zinc-cadmium efflux system membrane fusion protein